MNFHTCNDEVISWRRDGEGDGQNSRVHLMQKWSTHGAEHMYELQGQRWEDDVDKGTILDQ